ncbi:MAG TPA: hypothetical protein VFG78_13345, partial [Gemmatimonadota bacterium]|nr:hypothetical protein [Gemmatimonadota bacterium]
MSRATPLGLAAGLAVLVLTLPLTCDGPDSNGVAATRSTAAADSALARGLVEAARGAEPVVCGLAARALDQGSWDGGMRVEPAVADDP